MTPPQIVWQPQAGPQTEFCASDVFEVFYGGAAGGGKSDALLVESLRQVNEPDYRAIVFRRTTPQLRRMVDRSQQLIRKAFPDAEFTDSKMTWRFPSGAKLLLSHMEEEKDKFRHDGQEYQYVGFDELTHFTASQYRYLYSRCRTSNPALQCYIRATGMPMGEGVTWVKQRFIDGGAYNIINDAESGLPRQYIPSTLEDNKVLMAADPQYEARLKLMGTKLFRALRHGDWDVLEGASFEELDKSLHSLPPHIPPKGVDVWCAMDWGYARPFSVGWYYATADGTIVRFREWYGWNGEANLGMRMGARDVARGILAAEKDITVGMRYADPSIWNKVDDGNSIAENMRDEGVLFQPANNDRIQGKMEIHNRLRRNGAGAVGLRVTENCIHFWRTFPVLQPSTTRPEDVDSKLEDHLYDEVRYSLMSRRCFDGHGGVDYGDERMTANMDW